MEFTNLNIVCMIQIIEVTAAKETAVDRFNTFDRIQI